MSMYVGERRSSLSHYSFYFPMPSEEAKGMCVNCVRLSLLQKKIIGTNLMQK